MKKFDERYLADYLAWLIRNAFKESNTSGRDVSRDMFALVLNTNAFDADKLPNMLLGNYVTIAPLQSDIEIGLAVNVDDMFDKNVKKFVNAFYEVQGWSDFWYGSLWKEECGLEVSGDQN